MSKLAQEFMQMNIDELDEMPIEEVRDDFYAIMNGIVVAYGDNQIGQAPTNQQQTDQQQQAEGGMMEYQEQTISLACAGDRVVTVEAMRGIGTGLAYHPTPSRPELYTLTHIPTGYAFTELTMPTEQEVQAFLEKVADLDPDAWQIDLPTLKRRYNSFMRVQIELAHYDACSPYTIFMYPENDKPESFNAVADPQAHSNLALVAEVFCQYRSIERVRLVKMHRGTGEHEMLHVYTRVEVANA